MKLFFLSLLVVSFSASSFLTANALTPTANTFSPADKSKTASLQIPFVKNIGQVSNDIKFYADTFGGTLIVKQNGELVLAIPQQNSAKPKNSVISETLIGADIKSIYGAYPAVTKISYFRGSKPENWYSNVPTYKTVSLGEVYDDIELRLKTYNNNVEKLFYVRPGGDPGLIHVKVSGAQTINKTEEGLLALNTKHGIIQYTKPEAYQIVGNERHQVEVAYRVTGNAYSFVLGDYDKNKELVIDPLLQSTYFGGGNNDLIRALDVSPSGDVYAVGHTNSIISGVPGLPLYTRDGYDAFVARYNSTLTELLYVGFIGSSPITGTGKGEQANSITFRPTTGDAFEVYIAGYTASQDLAGVTDDSADHLYFDTDGCREGFVSRFSSDLMTLHGSTYYGGTAKADDALCPEDEIRGISIENILQPSGTEYRDEIFIAGITGATNIPGIVFVSPLIPAHRLILLAAKVTDSLPA